jgi:hypothetical protein
MARMGTNGSGGIEAERAHTKALRHEGGFFGTGFWDCGLRIADFGLRIDEARRPRPTGYLR